MNAGETKTLSHPQALTHPADHRSQCSVTLVDHSGECHRSLVRLEFDQRAESQEVGFLSCFNETETNEHLHCLCSAALACYKERHECMTNIIPFALQP